MLPDPEPGAGEIRVRVHASALNRADVLQRLGRYPAPPGAPQEIPGLEFAGVVDKLGAGVGSWRLGDRVMGLVPGGGHAEAVVLPEGEALAVPAGCSLTAAAAVPEAFMTAWDALAVRLRFQPGERLLIHAVGSGVGTAALQLARAGGGAEVFGTSRSPWKLERAARLGLEHCIDAGREDFARYILERTAGAGVEAVVDLVGGAYLKANLRVLAQKGRLAVLGLLAGATAELELGLLLRKRLTLVGSVLRSRPPEERLELACGFARDVLPLLEQGRVRPVIDSVMPMSEVRRAHERMEAGENFGKIVLQWDSPAESSAPPSG